MTVENTLAYYDTAKNTALKSFLVGCCSAKYRTLSGKFLILMLSVIILNVFILCHHNKKATLSMRTISIVCPIVMLSVMQYIAFMLTFKMLNVVLLNVVILNVVMLNVVMLNVVMLNVVMLNVVMLCVIILWCQDVDDITP